jgi:hypothetical protein
MPLLRARAVDLAVLLALLAILSPGVEAQSKAERRAKGSGGTSAGSSGEVNPALLDSPIWQLQDMLLSGYIPTVRPVLKPSDPVNVSINFVLFNIVEMVSSTYMSKIREREREWK